MKGFSSKHIAVTVDGLLDRKQFCLQARPCIFQPGNFTGWAVRVKLPAIYRLGSERVKLPAIYRLGSERVKLPAIYRLGSERVKLPAIYRLGSERVKLPAKLWQVDAAHRRLNYSYTASAPAYRKAHSWITSVSVEKTKPSSLDVNEHGSCSCEELSVFLFTLTSSPKSGQQL